MALKRFEKGGLIDGNNFKHDPVDAWNGRSWV